MYYFVHDCTSSNLKVRSNKHYLITYVPYDTIQAQNSQQKSVPDLYVVTVAFLALKKTGFFTFLDPKKNFKIFFYQIIM